MLQSHVGGRPYLMLRRSTGHGNLQHRVHCSNKSLIRVVVVPASVSKSNWQAHVNGPKLIGQSLPPSSFALVLTASAYFQLRHDILNIKVLSQHRINLKNVVFPHNLSNKRNKI